MQAFDVLDDSPRSYRERDPRATRVRYPCLTTYKGVCNVTGEPKQFGWHYHLFDIDSPEEREHLALREQAKKRDLLDDEE
jgi:hypothetical protein